MNRKMFSILISKKYQRITRKYTNIVVRHDHNRIQYNY